MKYAIVLAMLIGSFSAHAVSRGLQGPAEMDVLNCTTGFSHTGGSTAISLAPKDESSFELTGSSQGGMAHFIRLINKTELTMTGGQGDAVTYENAQTGMKLVVITTNINNQLVQTASFSEGGGFPAIAMTCTLSSK